MNALRNPKVLLGARILQVAFAFGFIIALGYSNSHPGTWSNLQGAVALGVLSFVFMLAVGFHALYEYFRHVEHFTTGWTRWARLGVEFVVFVMWIGSAMLMMTMPAGNNSSDPFGPPPPADAWAAGVGFAWAEVALYILTGLLVLLQFMGRRTKHSDPIGE